MQAWTRHAIAGIGAVTLGALALGSGEDEGTELVDPPPTPSEAAAPAATLPPAAFFTPPDQDGRLCHQDEVFAYTCDGEDDGRIALCGGEDAEWLQLRVRLPDGTEGSIPNDKQVRFVLSEEEPLPDDGVRERLEAAEGPWSAILFMDSTPDENGLMAPHGSVVFKHRGTETLRYACDPRYGMVGNSSAIRERAQRP